MIISNFKENDVFRFIGIGGASMSGLAEILVKLGFSVSGSDIRESAHTEFLRKIGVAVDVPHKTNGSPYDVLVASSAIPNDNPELVFARENGKTILSRGELLGLIAKRFDKVVAVSGSHGKSTVTAMLSKCLAHLSPTCHVGADAFGRTGTLIGNDTLFVTEACEYKNNFLSLSPDIAVITSVELDHTDFYGDLSSLYRSFSEFSRRSKCVLASDTLDFLDNAVTCGFKRGSVYRAENLSSKQGKYSFDMFFKDERLCRVNLSVYGLFNVQNALFALAAAHALKADLAFAVKAIENFSGLPRRFEVLKHTDRLYVSDYAHHPTELRRAIETAKSLSSRVFAVFQPHTYSRTKALLSEFCAALSAADKVFVLDTFAAREAFDADGAAERLAKALLASGVSAAYSPQKTDLFWTLYDLSASGDCILFVGAGDVDDYAKSASADLP